MAYLNNYLLRYLLLFSSFFSFGFSLAVDVVHWDFRVEKIRDGQYKIIYTANIDNGWHVYSQTPGEGPVATKIIFQNNPLVKVKSSLAKEIGKLIKHFDAGFGKELRYYEKQMILEQIVELKAKVKTKLQGHIEFMACDASHCLPPKKASFALDL